MNNGLRHLLQRYFDWLYFAMRDERRLAQLSLVDFNPEAVLLDCGCREGAGSVAIAQKMGTRKIIGIDFNFNALSLAAKRNILPLRANLNGCIPLANNTVDVILASDVLEHLVNPGVFVTEMYRVLKPAGYIILDTPNLASWHNIFALLLGIQPFSGPNITTMEDSDLELVRRMHRTTHGLPEQGEFTQHDQEELTRHIIVVAYVSLIRLLKRVGFMVAKAYGFGYYPLPVFLARLFQRIDIRHTHHMLIRATKPLK